MDESLDPALAKEAEGSPKEKALKALKDGYSILETDVPEATLTLNQKLEIEEAKRKIADLEQGGTGTEDVPLKDARGRTFKTLKEGIPVSELMAYLHEKHSALDPVSPEAKDLQDILRTLEQKKLTVDHLERHRLLKYPKQYQARLRVEMERMKQDGRSTGDELKDEEIAKDALFNRRELIIKPEKEDDGEKEDPRFTVSFVNANDDAKKMAIEGGAESVRAKLHVDKGIHPLQWMRAIKYKLGEPYYKNAEAHKVEAAGIEKKQYFMEIDAITGAAKEVNDGGELYKKQMQSTAERFSRKNSKVYEGEEREQLVNDELNTKINELVAQYAQGKLTAEQFASEQDIVIAALKANPETAKLLGDANFIATDMLPVAEKIKLSFERGEIGKASLNHMLDIQYGRAAMAANTEADYDKVDAIMKKLKNGKIRGWFANPLAIGVMITLSGAGAKSILGWGAKAATGFPLAGAAGGAVFAALDKWATEKDDRELQDRDSTYNKIKDLDSSPHRKALENFRINRAEGGGRVSAANLKAEITTLATPEDLTPSQIDAIIKKAAEIDTRIDFGIQNKVDLMTFTDRYHTETEKLELIIAKDEAMEIARKALKAADKTKTDAEIDSEINIKTIAATGEVKKLFIDTKEKQDTEFNKYRFGQATKAFIKGGIWGLVGGAVAQEGWALIGRHFGVDFTPTVIEKGLGFGKEMLRKAGIHVGEPSFSLAGLQEVFQRPTNLKLGNGLELAIDFQTHGERVTFPDGLPVPDGQPRPGWPDLRDDVRNVTFIDTNTGKAIDTHPFYLRSDGALIGAGEPGDFAKLDQRVQGVLQNWQKSDLADTGENAWFNLKADLKDMLSTDRNDAFVSANNLAVEVKGANPDGSKLVHMILHPELPAGSPERVEYNLRGFIGIDGNPNLTENLSANSTLKNTALINELTLDGWKLTQNGDIVTFEPSNATVFTAPEGLGIPTGPDAPFVPLVPSSRNPLENLDNTVARPGTPDRTPSTGITRIEPVGSTSEVGRASLEQQARAKDARVRLQEERRKLIAGNLTGGISPENQAKVEALNREIASLGALEVTPENRVLPEGPHELNEIFGRIAGEPISADTNINYLGDGVIEDLDLTPDQLETMAQSKSSKEPFFKNIKISADGLPVAWETNREVIPFVWDPRIGASTRFTDAENITSGDSGTLALAAVSASTPEGQANLYHAMADAILKVHNSSDQLLPQWWQVQVTPESNINNIPASSAGLFAVNDFSNFATQTLRPEKERLLAWNADGTINATALEPMWRARLGELREAIDQNKLEPHHLRWIEFLSHSIDLPELMDRIKVHSVITAPPPSPTPPTPQVTPTKQPTRLRRGLGAIGGFFRNQPTTVPPPTETLNTTVETDPAKIFRNAVEFTSEKGNILEATGVARVAEGVTADKFYWQEIDAGPALTKGSDDLYRGYAMVEPENIPGATQILIELAKKRASEGKPTSFKWLKMTTPSGLPQDELKAYVDNLNNLANYAGLEPTDPRIAIYADSETDVKEILAELAKDPKWKRFEETRTAKFGGYAGTPRRPGTNAYYDEIDVEWRSLNYGNIPGYSEWEAYDPNWRYNKEGSRTQPFNPTPIPPAQPVAAPQVDTNPQEIDKILADNEKAMAQARSLAETSGSISVNSLASATGMTQERAGRILVDMVHEGSIDAEGTWKGKNQTNAPESTQFDDLLPKARETLKGASQVSPDFFRLKFNIPQADAVRIFNELKAVGLIDPDGRPIETEVSENMTPPEDEDMYNRAVELAQRTGKVSISLLQRRLGIGYPRASNLLDQLETRGIISVAEDGRTGKVLDIPGAEDLPPPPPTETLGATAASESTESDDLLPRARTELKNILNNATNKVQAVYGIDNYFGEIGTPRAQRILTSLQEEGLIDAEGKIIDNNNTPPLQPTPEPVASKPLAEMTNDELHAKFNELFNKNDKTDQDTAELSNITNELARRFPDNEPENPPPPEQRSRRRRQ